MMAETTTRSGPTWRLIFAAVVVGLGGSFQFGYQVSVVNPAESVFRDHLNASWLERFDRALTIEEHAWLWTLAVNIFYVGALLGVCFVSVVAERFGRKNGILLANVPSFLGTLLITVWPFTPHAELLVVGRFVIGFHAGLASGLQPLYLTEIAPVRFRGLFGAFQELYYSVGVVIGAIVGLPVVLGTQEGLVFLLLLSGVPTLFHTFAMLPLPESPLHLLLTLKNEGAAAKSIEFFHGDEIDVKAVMKHEVDANVAASEELESGETARVPCDIKVSILIGSIAACSQVLSGLFALESFSTPIFIDAGIDEPVAAYATLGITVANLLAAVAVLGVIERLGRRPLLLGSMAGTCICNCLFVAFADIGLRTATRWCAWVAMCAYFAHMAIYSFGVGPIAWFLSAELVPQRYKSRAQTISIFSYWSCTIVTGACFFPLSRSIGLSSVIVVYAVPSAISFVFLFVTMPETMGRDLVAIVADGLARRRRMGACGGGEVLEEKQLVMDDVGLLLLSPADVKAYPSR